VPHLFAFLPAKGWEAWKPVHQIERSEKGVDAPVIISA